MTSSDEVPLRTTDALRGLVREEGDDLVTRAQIVEISTQLSDFRRQYKFALDEVLTKITILREEWDADPGRGPIEHVKHRLKSFDSILAKMERLELGPDLDQVSGVIRDIAGIRITCPYVEDVYKVVDTLRGQPDLDVIALKDYIDAPKHNGYRSLHLIVTVPVFMSTRTSLVPVEIQVRTIAMDFWASVEHEMRYKFDGDVPDEVTDSLALAARTAHELDGRMTHLRRDVLPPR